MNGTLLALCFVVLLGGCRMISEPAPAEALLRTDRAAYSPGDEAELRIINTGGRNANIPIGGGVFCFLDLQRRTGDGWSTLPGPDPCDVITISERVRPGRMARRSWTVDGAAFGGGGEFRLIWRYGPEYLDRAEASASRPFRVSEP
jgi:hypothetical protein